MALAFSPTARAEDQATILENLQRAKNADEMITYALDLAKVMDRWLEGEGPEISRATVDALTKMLTDRRRENYREAGALGLARIVRVLDDPTRQLIADRWHGENPRVAQETSPAVRVYLSHAYGEVLQHPRGEKSVPGPRPKFRRLVSEAVFTFSQSCRRRSLSPAP